LVTGEDRLDCAFQLKRDAHVLGEMIKRPEREPD
jgi:hypothetical protein